LFLYDIRTTQYDYITGKITFGKKFDEAFYEIIANKQVEVRGTEP